MKIIQLMHEWLYFIVLDEWKALIDLCTEQHLIV